MTTIDPASGAAVELPDTESPIPDLAETPVLRAPGVKWYRSGMAVCWANDRDIPAFAKLLLQTRDQCDAACILLYYSAENYPPEALADALRECPESTQICGSSTAGELSPEGLTEEGVVAILLPARHFTVAMASMPDIASIGLDQLAAHVRQLKSTLAEQAGLKDFRDVFALHLIDGLSYSEEAVAAALHTSLHDIPLIGGSAGDDLQFVATSVFCNGKVLTGGAALLLVHSRLPFKAFTNNNFVPTEHKLVVTDSNADQRTVLEFNAEPAAIAYARAVGLDPDNLSPNSFASYPVVVRIGGEHYCRSIQKCNPDGSLTFFCAIDNGIVLTIARPTGLRQSTSDMIKQLDDAVGGLDLIVGFDCILRRLDAANRDRFDEMSDIYRKANVIGFGTYGEQFNSMHINQTFTGVAFGTSAAD